MLQVPLASRMRVVAGAMGLTRPWRGGGEGNNPLAQPAADDMQQLRAKFQEVLDELARVSEALTEVKSALVALQQGHEEHENLWAAIAPKMVRIEAMTDGVGVSQNAVAGGAGPPHHLLVNRQRKGSQLCGCSKDRVKRWFA